MATKSYVHRCERRSLMHWDLYLWAHDEKRRDDASWHYQKYREATLDAYRDEEPEYRDNLFDASEGAIREWRASTYLDGMEWVRDDEEREQYSHA